MTRSYESITLTVHADRVQELLEFAGTLAGPKPEPVEAADDEPAAPDPFSIDNVTKAYRGGYSDHWRPFLLCLARFSKAASDHWVRWEDLYEAIGLTDRSAAGMLGAAERRCKGLLPYTKSYEGGYWFRMPESVADMIIDLAQDREAA